MTTKEDFHRLIDKIEDEGALKGYYQLVQRLDNNQTGVLWSSLNSEEKKELLVPFEEGLEADNLIPHHEVKSQHDKWLKK